MAKYQRVTGKILSRDSYREEHWNRKKNTYEEECIYALRVEYAVDGRIYTYSFWGSDVTGEVGGDYDVWYLEGNPQTVKVPDSENKKKHKRSFLWKIIKG